MLHDPKRDLTLANFAMWLETKDPKEAYHYPSRATCACGQWLRFLGMEDLRDRGTAPARWAVC